MNLDKLVKMAKAKNPNPQLARLSRQWAEKKKLGNPVRNAISRWYWLLFAYIYGVLVLLWATIAVLFAMHIFTFSNSTTKSNFWGVFGIFLFLNLVCLLQRKPETSKPEQDAKDFQKAITTLEEMLGVPLDQWPSDEDLVAVAETRLRKLALSIKHLEKTEEEEIERVPWVAPKERKLAAIERQKFQFSHELLTALLPSLPKYQGSYFNEE